MRQRNGKTEIWNTFKGRRGWKTITYVEAEMALGRAILRYWLNKDWMLTSTEGGKFIYLSEAGRLNLFKGLRNIIAKEPERRDEMVNVTSADEEQLA